MMLVQDVMQLKFFTVTPETTLPEAIRLTGQRGIRHLPVLDGDRLVGIVSDRDLERAMASPATSLEVHELMYLLDNLRVGEIMTRTVITIGPPGEVESDRPDKQVQERGQPMERGWDGPALARRSRPLVLRGAPFRSFSARCWTGLGRASPLRTWCTRSTSGIERPTLDSGGDSVRT
jgi:hypothetical protein